MMGVSIGSQGSPISGSVACEQNEGLAAMMLTEVQLILFGLSLGFGSAQ